MISIRKVSEIMKIAALYDIHGNLPALQAVLKELEQVQPDVIVLGGDIVSGPMPSQTLERLQQLTGKVLALRGNADREVVVACTGEIATLNLPEEVAEVTQWTAQCLKPEQRDFLAQLPEYVTLELDGIGAVLFCHATPYSDETIFTPLTPPERLRTLFHDVKQPLVICGHTHMQFELHVDGVQVLNAGSVGMPYADQPGAYWLLLTPEGCEFRKTSYDLATAAQAVKASGYPQAQEFAEENVLTVPPAAEVMKIFESQT
jgi:putative phosphoesterase